MRQFALALAILVALSGCIPIAVLRTPEPVNGSSIRVGLSGVVSTGGGSGFGILPLFSFARGDGETEFNLSAQLGMRLGVKQRLTEATSLDGGITVPYVLFVPDTGGIPLAADLGLLVGVEEFYLSPRVHWIGFSANGQAVSGWGYQLTGGYVFEGFLLELSYLGSFQDSGGFFSISGALRL